VEIINCEQGKEEWFKCRLSMVTASEFKSVLAKGEGKTRRTYMLKLASERLTGLSSQGYTNAAMEWGNETEPQARAAYELFQEVEVQQVGFCKLGQWVGCSPDSLVGNDGLLEIKCPNTTTQIDTILKGLVPPGHKAQIQGQLYVTGRQWCDFVSFDPRIPGKSQYFCKRVIRDDSYIDDILHPEIEKFVEELKKLVKKLK